MAAGTTDLPMVAPGATLPGVMTSRAIRILINRHGVIPGRRIAIVGNGVDAARLGSELTAAGCGCPDLLRRSVEAILGDGGVQSIRGRDGATMAIDIVVVARGEVPDLQLAGMLELPRVFDPALAAGGFGPTENRLRARRWWIAPGTGKSGRGGPKRHRCCRPNLPAEPD